MTDRRNRFMENLQEFSIPLLLGVLLAMLAANLSPAGYAEVLHWHPFGDVAVFGHSLSFHFLVNDVFMVFFFGIAAKEITESTLPGGSLNPIHKAITPLVATLGGVVGPVVAFFAGLHLLFGVGIYDHAVDDFTGLSRGWGIPTATDIALAWLAARTVFGRGHPAVAFLLLLAVADDAIGLIIIAIFYGDPAHPVAPVYLLLVVTGMGISYALRRANVRQWYVYVGIGGPLAWAGLVLAHLHPALALVMIVPFMPGPHEDTGLFVDRDEVDVMGEETAAALHIEHSPLHLFEHQLKLAVDFGLFFFAFANAGVELASIGPMTWLILGALVVGKTIGVTLGAVGAVRVGFALPAGMGMAELVMAGFIAALGLTVALFVATAAYLDPILQGQAKMGALFSGAVGLIAVVLGRALGLGSRKREPASVPKAVAAEGPKVAGTAPEAASGATPDPIRVLPRDS
jgi:NhaA family Na+:H+ antiporter